MIPSRKVAGSNPNEVIGFFSIDPTLPAATWPYELCMFCERTWVDCNPLAIAHNYAAELKTFGYIIYLITLANAML